MDEIQKFVEIYRQETEELLVEVEETILELEENPEDSESIDRLFRAVHTIKGAGGMLGFHSVEEFTHTLETVLDKVRDGILPISKDLIDLILKSRDHIKYILEMIVQEEPIDIESEEVIVNGLKKFLSEIDEDDITFEDTNKEAEATIDEKEYDITYRIRFKPHRNIFSNGSNPVPLLEALKELGECEIIMQVNEIPFLDDLDPEGCYLFWDIILTTKKDLNTIRDVFIFVEDACDLFIDIVEDESNFTEEVNTKKLGEIMVERKDVTVDQINQALNEQKRLGEILVDSEAVDQQTVKSALIEQNRVKKIKEKRREEKGISSLRVTADKLDTLVDLVGEMVTVQARLSQLASFEEHSSLMPIAEEVERLVMELRDNTMSIRMMPIGTTFSKFKRLVRDLSSELGKNIDLITEGAETELDKTVIDRLDDPLVHLIRNCIDHGIESPDIRRNKGKPERGTIRLSATHRSAYVIINIEDDGVGLNPEAIREKGVEKGLISKDSTLPEREIFDLIFTPGFSTSKNLSNVSGRGVGMDIVKKTIESLRGTIEVDSTVEKGTTITLKLPLTLAIINGLLVTMDDVHYVLPLANVEECVELTHEKDDQTHGANMLNVRGEIVPYVRLRDRFEINGDRPDLEHIVIADVHEKRVGFVVDNVLGGYQTVIKPLGPAFRHMKDISGATILGDGTVALILDVNALV